MHQLRSAGRPDCGKRIAQALQSILPCVPRALGAGKDGIVEDLFRVVAILLFAGLGLFLIGCAIVPPPFFQPLSPFERIIGALVGCYAMGVAVHIYQGE